MSRAFKHISTLLIIGLLLVTNPTSFASSYFDKDHDPSRPSTDFQPIPVNSLGTQSDFSDVSCVNDYVSAWTTSSGSYGTIIDCTVVAPVDGQLFISANASAAINQGGYAYEALFRLTLDSVELMPTHRYVNAYTDWDDGTDRNVVVSTMVSIQSGSHTVNFQGILSVGSGPVKLLNPRLSIIFIPNEGIDLRTCDAQRDGVWTTTSSTFVQYLSCTLQTSKSGWVYLSTDVSIVPSDAYWVTLRIGVDSPYADPNLDRTVRIYTDALSDGTDENAAITTIQRVNGAGWHNFYLFAKRDTGPGTVNLYDGNLTVIFVPDGSPTLHNCEAHRSSYQMFNDGNVHVLESCTIDLPIANWVYISADAMVMLSNTNYEGVFDFSIDTPNMDTGAARRYIDMSNPGDFNDFRGVALSKWKYLSAGTHTIYFMTKRRIGTGNLLVNHTSLSVLAPGGRLFIPLALR